MQLILMRSTQLHLEFPGVFGAPELLCFSKLVLFLELCTLRCVILYPQIKEGHYTQLFAFVCCKMSQFYLDPPVPTLHPSEQGH